MARGEEAFAEVARHDFFLAAYGSEIDAGVPSLKYIDVRRYIVQLSIGQDSGFLGASRLGMSLGEKGLKELGDARDLHVRVILDGRLGVGERGRVSFGVWWVWLKLRRTADFSVAVAFAPAVEMTKRCFHGAFSHAESNVEITSGKELQKWGTWLSLVEIEDSRFLGRRRIRSGGRNDKMMFSWGVFSC